MFNKIDIKELEKESTKIPKFVENLVDLIIKNEEKEDNLILTINYVINKINEDFNKKDKETIIILGTVLYLYIMKTSFETKIMENIELMTMPDNGKIQ